MSMLSKKRAKAVVIQALNSEDPCMPTDVAYEEMAYYRATIGCVYVEFGEDIGVSISCEGIKPEILAPILKIITDVVDRLPDEEG